MKWLLYALVAFLLLTTALVSIARRDDSGWIAYQSGYSDNRAIYIMTGDGRAQHRLTPFDLCGGWPRWSPNGRAMVFQSLCTNENNLYFMPIGARPRLVSEELSRIVGADWSPDGSRLVVTSEEYDLIVVEVESGDARLLASGYTFPQWSPDGAWIYAHFDAGMIDYIVRIHPQTGQVERVIGADLVSPISWSPDATRIAVRIGSNELVIMNPDGSGKETIFLPIKNRSVQELIWSPDGESIVIALGNILYRVRLDRKKMEYLAEHTAGVINQMQWSLDGNWLVFYASFPQSPDIVRVRADGSAVESLIPSGNDPTAAPHLAPVVGLAWHPALMTVAALGILALSLTGNFRR